MTRSKIHVADDKIISVVREGYHAGLYQRQAATAMGDVTHYLERREEKENVEENRNPLPAPFTGEVGEEVKVFLAGIGKDMEKIF